MPAETAEKKRFHVPKKAVITDTFRCRLYPDLQPISYKVCLGRQLAKTPAGGFLYPECPECPDGGKITKHFKDWNLKKKQRPNWNTAGVAENMKKMTKKPNSETGQLANQLLLLRAQLDYLAGLLHAGKMKEALTRLTLITEALKED